MNEEIKKAALSLLEDNKQIKEIYATVDGNLFFAKHHAEEHARSIKCEVITITREDTNTPEDTTVPPVANAATMYDVDPKPIKPVDPPADPAPADPEPKSEPEPEAEPEKEPAPADPVITEKKNE